MGWWERFRRCCGCMADRHCNTRTNSISRSSSSQPTGTPSSMPNPRGSTGRGEKYAMGIYAAWGSVDVEDGLAAVDDAVARGLADPDRLVVGGWSYGGISTNYIIATTTRFKAAVSGASASNVLAGYGTDEYIRDYENELGLTCKNTEL